MIEIPTQIRDACPVCKVGFGRFFLPFGDESAGKAMEFKPNQITRSKITGVKHPRSVVQLNTYWACCRTVADNLDGQTKESVDFECKVTLRHIKSFRMVNGVTFIEVDSIAFKNLAHLEACNYFDRAFPVLAKMIGVTEDKLIEMAQSEMQSR